MTVVPSAPSAPSSILICIKKMLGIDSSYTAFDTDIIININSALMALEQIGVGPTEGFSITDAEDVWADLLTNDKKVDAAKTYIYFKVKLAFDPPTSGFVVEAINKQLDELAWRLAVQTDIPIEDLVLDEEEEVVLGDFEDG